MSQLNVLSFIVVDLGHRTGSVFGVCHKPRLCFASFREDAKAGALMAFGFNLDAQWRLGAGYVDQILKGQALAQVPRAPAPARRSGRLPVL